jgi:hypothetical protein
MLSEARQTLESWIRQDAGAARWPHALTIIVAAQDLEPASLRLEPIADPAAQLRWSEPPDA